MNVETKTMEKKHAHTKRTNIKKNSKLEESGKSDSPMVNSKRELWIIMPMITVDFQAIDKLSIIIST